MKNLKKYTLALVTILMLIPSGILAKDDEVQEIVLNSTTSDETTYSFSATLNGEAVKEYDYTWNIDPSGDYSEVKNSPAEYYTGTEPGDEDVYIAHDIYYYPELDSSKYVKGQYGDDIEWLYYYDNEEYSQYVFATLPVEGTEVPTRMMHSAEEAYNNAVLHITKAGTYRLTGTWHGQIYIDLGEDSFDDETAVVTLILNNVDIECTVASGICFYQVYECDNAWEDREEAITTVDTSAAGANIIIADGSTNTVSGANIYRILKTKYKDEDSTDAIKEQKKRLKVDGALYSYMSMNINGGDKGTGTLTINSEFEGLDTELHLTINGGNINIVSDNDGINVNEDNVSIFTMNGGTLQILAGTGYEGDGIDSNGYLNVNGGTVISSAKPQSDSGLDSDCGTYINGGNVLAFGSSMDVVTEYNEDAQSVTMNLSFSSQQNLTDAIVFTDTEGNGVCGFDLSGNTFFNSANRTYQCLVISNEKFAVGTDYNVYNVSVLKGTDTNGIYTEIKKYTASAQLSYTAGQIGGMGGGMGRGGMGTIDPNQQQDSDSVTQGGAQDIELDPADETDNQTLPNGDQGGQGTIPSDGMGGQGGTMPTMPNGDQGTQDGTTPTMPNGNQSEQDGTAPTMPNENGDGTTPTMPNGDQGTQDGTMPEMPDGDIDMSDLDLPDGLDIDGNMSWQDIAESMGESSMIFTASDKVNSFANVTATAIIVTDDGDISVSPIALAGIIAGVLIIGVGAGIIIGKKKKAAEETAA